MVEKLIMVSGVGLPADELEEALLAYVDRRLLADRGARAGSGTAFRSVRWVEAARAVRSDASERLERSDRSDSLTSGELITLTEFAARVGVAQVTVRRWAATGRLLRATKTAGRWLVPADAELPVDGRRKVGS